MSSLEVDVDRYLQHATYGDDPYGGFVARSSAAGLPEIQVSAVFGRLLELLARLSGARAVLEVGTLGGYSAAWLARGLAPGGRVISLEIDPHHAEVARENLAAVGFADVVEVRVGPALLSLDELAGDPTIAGSVDLAFIDADKVNNPRYVEHAVALARPGALIIVDNVVRAGTVLEADSTDPSTRGSREVLELLGSHPRLAATALQTVGQKGHDGFALAVVTA
jgi:predicted O-methyltransferase YrrM